MYDASLKVFAVVILLRPAKEPPPVSELLPLDSLHYVPGTGEHFLLVDLYAVVMFLCNIRLKFKDRITAGLADGATALADHLHCVRLSHDDRPLLAFARKVYTPGWSTPQLEANLIGRIGHTTLKWARPHTAPGSGSIK